MKMSSFFVGLFFLIILLLPQVALATTGEDIPIDSEYASGVITQPGRTMKMSYAWVNSNSSEFLSITMFDDIYKVALFRPFFGQAYNVDNSEFFVGTMLTGFELFQDSNGNNVLDLAEELKYYIMLNASQEYILPVIEKTVGDVTQYSWKVCYLEIDGFFNPYEGPYMARTIIESVNLSYIFEVHENHTELKLAIEMGEWDAYEFDFDMNTGQLIRLDDVNLEEYSLSLLFGTTVSSEEPFTMTMYNGSTGLEDLRVEVNGVPIFQSLFQDTYDLGLNGSAFQATTTPANVETLYDDQLQFWGTPASFYDWWQSWFPSMSNLSVPAVGLEEASFLYRICYPIWGGEPFNHDPRYRALFDGELNLPPTTTEPTSNPPETSTTNTTTTIGITSLEISAVLMSIFLITIPLSRKRRN